MNINEAKDQIKNAIIAYRTKNEYGRYLIPLHKQRPLFLVGPPGIGKTAIIEQIAQELHIGLVSYSITHHTRQSALGLPYIQDEEFDGQSYRISEYTMSEIIASIYKKMKETSIREGILFLDEINCVSETLAPSMLQFLQYKVFGQHHIPDGWIVVTAGNPPQYNQSVREFDMVTEDRLKRIDIEPDYQVWKTWAINEDIHPSILSYLDIRNDQFYKVENTIDGRSFVTPRGWSDLSIMMKLYEMNHIEIDELLIKQYLRDEKIAHQFSVYFELWKKYQSDYKVDDILAGQVSEDIIERAKKASFDERISLIGLLLDKEKQDMNQVLEKRHTLVEAKKIIQSSSSILETIEKKINDINISLSSTKRELLSENDQDAYAFLKQYLEEILSLIQDIDSSKHYEIAKEYINHSIQQLQILSDKTSKQLENIFQFLEKAFGEGQEILLVVTELTSSSVCARYISIYGSDAYFKYNKDLLFYERNQEILKEIDALL
ncbi:MAG: AAA family ATPase [Erysipelotrichaceae bacterium]|nr:AAA family ATPase [Erysipelotrichaceae bacterium]